LNWNNPYIGIKRLRQTIFLPEAHFVIFIQNASNTGCETAVKENKLKEDI